MHAYVCVHIDIKKMFLTGLSVDGDSQGVERLYGALSAHMWPGMVLKSGNKITEPSLPEKEGSPLPPLLENNRVLPFSFNFYLLINYMPKIFHPLCSELSSRESDYEFEYEILSAGSAEPWDDTDKVWVSANGITPSPEMARFVAQSSSIMERDQENGTRSNEEKPQPSTSSASLQDENIQGVIPDASEQATEVDEGTHFDFEDLE